MAVVIDAVCTGPISSSANPTSYTNQTVGSGTNRALIVALVVQDGSDQSAGLTLTWDQGGTNQTLTLIDSEWTALSGCNVQFWGLTNPTAGNKTLRVAGTPVASFGVEIASLSVNGANQSGGVTTFHNTTSNNATGTLASVVVTSVTGELVIANFGCGGASFTTTDHSQYYLDGGTVGNYANGAASVNLQAGVGSSKSWVGQGLSVAAAVAFGSALLQGAGQLVAAARQIELAQAELFDGIGALTANALKLSLIVQNQLFAGASNLTVPAFSQSAASATLTGAAGLTVVPTGNVPAATLLTGVGRFTAGKPILFASATSLLSGAGTLNVAPAVSQIAAARLSGAGSVFYTQVFMSGTNFVGVGKLLVSALLSLSSGTLLAGRGTLTVLPFQRRIAQAQFGGTGALRAFMTLPTQIMPAQTLRGSGSLLVTSILNLKGFVSASLGGSGGLAVAAQLSPSIRHYDPTYWGTGDEVMITANDNDGHMLIVEPGTLVGRPPTAAGAGRAEIITPLPPLIWSGDTLVIDPNYLSSINSQIAALQQQVALLFGVTNPLATLYKGSGGLTCNATGGHNWGTPTTCAALMMQGVSSGATVTLPIVNSVPAGALVIVGILNVPNTGPNVVVGDTQSNSYDNSRFGALGSSTGQIQLAFAANVNALVAGVDSIKFTNPFSTQTFIVSAFYIQGAKTTGVLDAINNASGTAGPSRNLTYALDTNLIVGIVGFSGSLSSDPFSQSAGFYNPPLQTQTVNGVARLGGGIVVSQSGQTSKTYAPSVTFTHPWGIVIAAFKSS